MMKNKRIKYFEVLILLMPLILLIINTILSNYNIIEFSNLINNSIIKDFYNFFIKIIGGENDFIIIAFSSFTYLFYVSLISIFFDFLLFFPRFCKKLMEKFY